MDSLSAWYRYIDRVSRPARKSAAEDGESAPRSWRPWLPTEDGIPEIEGAVRAEDIPDLSFLLGREELPAALQPATPTFEDPTVDFELEPIPQFEVPTLSPPSLSIPSPSPLAERVAAVMARSTTDSSEATDAATTNVALDEEAGEEAEEWHLPGEDADESVELCATKLAHYRDLLSSIDARDIAQNSYKAPFRESREDLLRRLVDPTLTLAETARLLDVCPATVRRYANKGTLRHFRTSGNQRRFRLLDVLEFLESRSAEIEADRAAEANTEGTDRS